MKFASIIKKGAALLLSLGLCVGLGGCQSKEEQTLDLSQVEFEQLVEQAKGTTVSFYGWGGDELINHWIDETFAPLMKEKYDITIERVPMDIDQILNKLSSEVQAGKTDGSIDMIWINGENFFSAKENDLLYGPFTQALPNFAAYVDETSDDTCYDFAYPIEGYEAPYGKAQLVLINDSNKTPETPSNAQELLDFVKKYPGQVTYPAPPDFTGSAFVRNIIYEFVDPEVFMDMEADKETVKAAIQPALDYLRELNPYLWKEGTTFPATVSQQETMYMDGELLLHMRYESYWIATAIEQGMCTQTSRSFLFDNGTIGNTNFVAVAKNSPNKAGALVAINELLTPEVQASRYEQLKILLVLDNSKLSDEEKALFDAVDPGPGTIAQEELLEKRLPEMPVKLVPIIEQLWQEEVVGK